MVPVVGLLYPVRSDRRCIGLTATRSLSIPLRTQAQTLVDRMSDSSRLREVIVIAVRPERTHCIEQDRQYRCQVGQFDEDALPRRVVTDLVPMRPEPVYRHHDPQRIEFTLQAIFE